MSNNPRGTYTTLRDWFEKDEFECIMFLKKSEESFQGTEWEGLPTGRLLTWEQADKWLDVEFDKDFGARDLPRFFAWGDDAVYFVEEGYDERSTFLGSAPRDPIEL